MRGYFVGAALLLASAGAIAALQAPAARHCRDVKEQSEVYVLPPPEQLIVMSLGYRSALADLMWADVLTTQGFRLQEKRRYETILPQLEGLASLDPQFREPFLIGDALVTYSGVEAREEEARGTRHFLEIGVKNRPLDAELWDNLGNFVAFFAPSSILTDPAEIDAWRRDGAAYLERAVELSGDNTKVAWRALGGGVNFAQLGDRDAAIRFFNKVIENTEDEELRAKARAKLEEVANDGALSEEERRAMREKQRFEARRFQYLEWQRKLLRRSWYAGLHSDAMRVIGPPRPAAVCAGGRSEDPLCSKDWATWTTHMLQAPDAP